jgi:hypothetical protein
LEKNLSRESIASNLEWLEDEEDEDEGVEEED